MEHIAHLCKAPDIIWKEVGGAVHIVTPSGNHFVLEGLGATIWRMIDGSTSTDDIIASLKQRYPTAGEGRLEIDVTHFIRGLLEQNLLKPTRAISSDGMVELPIEHKPQDHMFLRAWAKNIPLKVYFNITSLCNLACRHCYATQNMRDGRTSEDLTVPEVRSILDQLDQAGCLMITLTGGEPLCYPGIFEVLDYAKHKRISVRLNTNGTLLGNAAVERLRRSSVELVLVSIHGATANTHDHVTRVPGSFNRTLAGLKCLQAAGINTVVSFLATRRNCHETEQVHRLVEEDLGLKLSISPYVIPDFVSGRIPVTERMTDNQLVEFMRLGLFKPGQMKCSIGHQCVVNSNGDIYPCLCVPVSVGNLRKHTFQEIWNSPAMNRFRNDTQYLEPPVICQQCQHFSYCHRCPAVAQLEDGNLQKPSSEACRICNAYANVCGVAQ